jgi:hypothetical protein
MLRQVYAQSTESIARNWKAIEAGQGSGEEGGEGLRLHMTPEFRPTNCWLKTPAALTTGVHQVQPLKGNVKGYTKNVGILTGTFKASCREPYADK